MSLSMNLMKMTLKANSIVEAHTTVFMHKNLIYKHSCSSNEWSFKKVFVGYKCFVTDKDLALTWSFSHKSYGIGHAPSSHIIAYVPEL